MLTKRISGIIIVILGIALILSSFYIKSRVSSGREQISEAEESVKQGKELFSSNPFTKEIGKHITGSVEKKIKEGSDKADTYDTLALWFQIGGSAFVVIGSGLIFISRKRDTFHNLFAKLRLDSTLSIWNF